MRFGDLPEIKLILTNGYFSFKHPQYKKSNVATCLFQPLSRRRCRLPRVLMIWLSPPTAGPASTGLSSDGPPQCREASVWALGLRKPSSDQFHQRFLLSFYTQRSQKPKKNTAMLTVFFVLSRSSSAKAANKMLVKLNPRLKSLNTIHCHIIPWVAITYCNWSKYGWPR